MNTLEEQIEALEDTVAAYHGIITLLFRALIIRDGLPFGQFDPAIEMLAAAAEKAEVPDQDISARTRRVAAAMRDFILTPSPSRPNLTVILGGKLPDDPR